MAVEAFKNLTGAGQLAAVVQVIIVVVPMLTYLKSVVSASQAAYITFAITVLNGLVVLIQAVGGNTTFVKE
jgi:hypothetical protein